MPRPSLCPWRWSIKAKSVALFATYVLALCTVYVAFTVALLRRESAAANERLLQTSRMLAADIDGALAAGRQHLTTVAALPGLMYGLRTIREAGDGGHIPPWTTLHYLFFKSPIFTGGVFLLDDAGTVLWTEPPGREWAGLRLGDVSPIAAVFRMKTPLVSGVLDADRLLDAPHVVLVHPIRGPDGEIVGVLGGVIKIAASPFAANLAAAPTEGERFAAVVDQDGRILAGTGSLALMQPVVPARKVQGERPLVATTVLTQAPWQVIVGQRRSTALADINHLQRLLLGAGVVLVLATMVTGGPFVAWLIRSLKSLTEHAETMARGDLSRPVTVPKRDDEIATLARTFERMRAELERSQVALTQRVHERDELIRLKEEFLANMSHELRTPLNVIMGYTDMVLDESLPPASEELLQRIRSQSEHLFQLLQDVMTLSGLNTGRITPEIHEVSVAEIFARLAPLVQGLQRGRELRVEWEAASDIPALHTDPLRLEKVLANLITNAFKFTALGVITIRARHDAERRRLEFQVSDTGIGIPAEAIPHIFDEFRQVDGSMSRGYGGMGLGLALASKLAALLEGELHVDSRVHEGSTFALSVPYRPSSLAEADTWGLSA
jgi:signal transduction histidine kinase